MAATTDQRVKPRPTDVIRVLVGHNPKVLTKNSWHRFDCYKDGMTVADYEDAVYKRLGEYEARRCKADLQWDCDRNFIRLERDGQPIDIPVSPSMQRP